jgi:hypothetical protein
MGQLKWCWLRRSRRQVQDIQAMDDASRGPLGAFSVLVFWTGGSLAALGSIITLLMIAFGPFLQQLVEYPSRNMTQHDSFALAPRNLAYTLHFPPTSDEFAISPWEENVELVHLLEAGIWSDPKPFDQEPTCSTGHCSWPEYKSVGWCGKCEDRTHSSTLRNCKAVDIRENKNYTTEYCVLDLGNGHKAPLFKDLEVTLDEDDTLNINGNYTAEAIWPFNSGNSGATMSILGVTELSSGPEKILGVDNPLIAIAHATVKLANDSYEDLEFNVLQIVETSQCILHPCEKEDLVSDQSQWHDDVERRTSQLWQHHREKRISHQSPRTAPRQRSHNFVLASRAW